MSLHYKGRMGDGLLYTMGECKIILSGPSERAEIGHFAVYSRFTEKKP